MLDKVDRRWFSGTDPVSILQSIQGTLYQYGIQAQQVGPASWSGRGQHPSWGIVPKVGFTITEAQGSVMVDLRVSADIEGNGIVVLVLCWLFFFPLAIVFGVLGYQDFDRRAHEILAAVWAPLSHKLIAPPAPQWGAGAVGAPPVGGQYGGPR